MSCPDCGNTGYRTVEVPVFMDGGYSDVDQITERCACNPEPDDEDVPEWAVDLGCGPIDFAELGRLDKQMNRERAAALRDLGEPLSLPITRPPNT